jgi:hypothetical protein
VIEPPRFGGIWDSRSERRRGLRPPASRPAMGPPLEGPRGRRAREADDEPSPAAPECPLLFQVNFETPITLSKSKARSLFQEPLARALRHVIQVSSESAQQAARRIVPNRLGHCSLHNDAVTHPGRRGPLAVRNVQHAAVPCGCTLCSGLKFGKQFGFSVIGGARLRDRDTAGAHRAHNRHGRVIGHSVQNA